MEKKSTFGGHKIAYERTRVKGIFFHSELDGIFSDFVDPGIFIPLYSGGDNGRILYGCSCAACFFLDRSF